MGGGTEDQEMNEHKLRAYLTCQYTNLQLTDLSRFSKRSVID